MSVSPAEWRPELETRFTQNLLAVSQEYPALGFWLQSGAQRPRKPKTEHEFDQRFTDLHGILKEYAHTLSQRTDAAAETTCKRQIFRF